MTDPYVTLTISTASLAGLAMVVGAGLTGWRGWLQLKRSELDRLQAPSATSSGAGTRIEMADLKERIRKLEAIAAGVEL